MSGRAETHNLARTKGCHGETGEKEDGTMVHPGTGQPSPHNGHCALLVLRACVCGALSALGLVPSDFFPPVMSSWIGKNGVY